MASASVTRRAALAGTLATQACATLPDARAAKTFLVCHGAWSAGWAWRKMRPLLHRPPESVLFTPTMTGVGERAHLVTRDTNLETHITDLLAVIQMEDLHDITLIGHSYGGIVATGVADRARDKIRQLIYLDAFVPHDGESLYDITGQSAPSHPPLLVEPRPVPPDTSNEDALWIAERRTPHPLASFTQRLRLSGEPLAPRSYIRCTRVPPDDPLRSSAERARAAGWPYRELDASHSPHVTAPEALHAAVIDLLV